MQQIDMHAHYYGGALLPLLEARQSWPCLKRRPDGQRDMIAMNGAFPFTDAYFDPQAGLAQMKATGLTRRLLTFPGALGVDLLPGVQAEISAFNDHLAELSARTGGALIGLAGVPLADLDRACDETRRIRRDLGLPGIILPSDYFNSLAEARSLEPLLAAANETGCHIMLHPGLKVGDTPPAPPPDNTQYRLSAVDLQSGIAQVALTVILSEVLEAYPRLTFQIVNLGGTLPFIFERLEAIGRHRSPDTPFPTNRLRRLWYDCASLGPRALEAAVKLYGADRIMLGSDYPIFCDAPYDHAVAPSDLSVEEKEQVAWKTAAALLDRLDLMRLSGS